MKQLTEMLPLLYSEADQKDGSLAAFGSVYDDMHAELLTHVLELGQVALPQTTPEAFLADVANRYGNPFKFLSVKRMRGKVENLSAIYRRRGTKSGIVSACYYLCGIIPKITEDFEWGWVLGTSELGIDTRLVDANNPSFWVTIPASVPQDIRDEMAAIVDFMKPSRIKWRFVLEEGMLPIGDLEFAGVVGDNLSVRGWAADVMEGAPVMWVDILLDGISIGHADADEVTVRADVQAIMDALGTDKDCTKSGWTFLVPLADLQQGPHTVKAIAHKNDGQMAEIGTQDIAF